jgi:hypothetical protein
MPMTFNTKHLGLLIDDHRKAAGKAAAGEVQYQLS